MLENYICYKVLSIVYLILIVLADTYQNTLWFDFAQLNGTLIFFFRLLESFLFELN